MNFILLHLEKIYHSIEQLQQDLDIWMREYNTIRTHSGKYCYGKTPLNTFYDSIELAKKYYIESLNENYFNKNNLNFQKSDKYDKDDTI